MVRKPSFFVAFEQLVTPAAARYPLERLYIVVDFKLLGPVLEAVLKRADGSWGGGRRNDAVVMFRTLVLQTLYTLSHDQTAYQLQDWFSFMRFASLGLDDPVRDAKTI